MPLEFQVPFAFAFGLCVGSFLNVVIHRLPFGDSLVWPGSRCPNCFHAIPWYRNVPVVSWLKLCGRCAHCRYPIAIRYPAIELTTGLLFAGLAMTSLAPGQFLVLAYFASVLVAAAMIDFDFFILPDVLTYQLAIVGIVLQLLVFDMPWLQLAAAVSIGPAILLAIRFLYWAIRRQEGLGLGDVKLMAGVGAFLGVDGALFTLVVGSLFGSIVGLGLVAGARAGMRSQLPFGPFLVLAALLWLFLSLFGVAASWANLLSFR